jgi:serine/threonine protein kinase
VSQSVLNVRPSITGVSSPASLDAILRRTSAPQGKRSSLNAFPSEALSPLSTSSAISSAPDVETTHEVMVQRDRDGNKIVNQYVVVKHLGRGVTGKVKLVEHRETKERFALKILNKSMLRRMRVVSGFSALQQVQVEIAVMKKLRHRNIVALYEVIDDPSCNKMYLVEQYVEEAHKLQLNPKTGCGERLDVELVRAYAKQLASGINYLHRNNIVHRDIKPDNLLLAADGHLYVADFGVSLCQDDVAGGMESSMNHTVGTPAFFSPELCRGEAELHGKASDMWAVGVSLYAMLCGHLPFFADSLDGIMHCIQNRELAFPEFVAPEWRELLAALLNKDPTNRMTAAAMRKSGFLFRDDLTQSFFAAPLDVAGGRRLSDRPPMLVDATDIRGAIAVAVEAFLEVRTRRSPRDKLHSFVESVRNRVRSRLNQEALQEDAGTAPRCVVTCDESHRVVATISPSKPRDARTGSLRPKSQTRYGQ